MNQLPKSRRPWKRLLIALGLAAVAMAAFATLRDRSAGSESLDALVEQVAAAIEMDDETRLSEFCHDAVEVPFERLQRQHAALNYVQLLHEDRGWKTANAWTLGGHGDRFGHIHFDFVRQLDGRWHLKRIWQCR